MSNFDPLIDIPSFLWQFIDGVGPSIESWKIEARKLDRAEFDLLFAAYLDARTELVDKLTSENRFPNFSEDDIEDVCDGVVASGKRRYFDAYNLKITESPKIEPKLGVLESEYYQKYECSPFDAIE